MTYRPRTIPPFTSIPIPAPIYDAEPDPFPDPRPRCRACGRVLASVAIGGSMSGPSPDPLRPNAERNGYEP